MNVVDHNSMDKEVRNSGLMWRDGEGAGQFDWEQCTDDMPQCCKPVAGHLGIVSKDVQMAIVIHQMPVEMEVHDA